MTSELSFSEHFPYLHPLYRNQQENNPVLRPFRHDIETHYESHLPQGYLNLEKLEKSITFLNTISGNKIEAIEILSERFDSTDLRRMPKLILENGPYSIFWLFQTSAFLLLNLYIESPTEELKDAIYICFRNAQNYKIGWIEREGRRKGAAGKIAKFAELEKKFYTKWKTYSTTCKKLTYRSTFELFNEAELYPKPTPEDDYKIPSMRTLQKWIREWHKMHP